MYLPLTANLMAALLRLDQNMGLHFITSSHWATCIVFSMCKPSSPAPSVICVLNLAIDFYHRMGFKWILAIAWRATREVASKVVETGKKGEEKREK